MFPGPTAVTAGQRELLKLWKRLGDDDRKTLLAFARFLGQQRDAGQPQAQPAQAPRDIPRPAQESVVAAIKRLSATYPMIDKSDMLHSTSGLMAQHMLQGRAAADVIDELERIFAAHYKRHTGSPDS